MQRVKNAHPHHPRRKKWVYKNTTLLILSVLVFFLLADTPFVHAIVDHVGGLGYFGAFISGVFFVSTFTVAPASVVLFEIARHYPPLYVALCSAVGAVIGDLLIYRLFKGHLFKELSPLLTQARKQPLFALFKSPYFGWVTPVVGALLIASPFPDEIGIGMMGLSKIKQWQFILLTYALNTFGILAIILVAQAR